MKIEGNRIILEWGYVEFGFNELTIVSTVPDPPKVRQASPTGSLGAYSFNLLRPDGSQQELVLIQGKKDERTRGRNDVNYGELSVHITGPGEGDAAQVHVASLHHDYVWLKGISGAYNPPAIELPPAPPPEDWNSPENHMKHLREVHRIEIELGQVMDEDRMNAYLTGRNKNLAEVHDDELVRSGLDHDPCNGLNRIPL